MNAGAREAVPLAIDAGHPAFAGHFPGRPLVPGVVLLAEVMAVLESRTSRAADGWVLAQAKFTSPALPGEALAMRHETLAGGAVRWEIRCGERLVASGLATPRNEAGDTP